MGIWSPQTHHFSYDRISFFALHRGAVGCHNSFLNTNWYDRLVSDASCYSGTSLFCISGALAVHDPHATLPQEKYEKQGFIISHRDFPKDYTANISSSLIISGLHPQQIVRVKFLFFQIYYLSIYPVCDFDYLLITVRGGLTFCSDPQYQPDIDVWYNFTAADSQLKFQFVTNGNPTTAKGFYLQYEGGYNTQKY